MEIKYQDLLSNADVIDADNHKNKRRPYEIVTLLWTNAFNACRVRKHHQWDRSSDRVRTTSEDIRGRSLCPGPSLGIISLAFFLQECGNSSTRHAANHG